ncbi:hypothetical protein [Aerococcus suis]|uniref:Uncharacterized protein n=1 Tax=Aerococcus suis TaxID=371602 RepID=A0A1W1YNU4_9LACT|nr:hypothetical protein [Aerococcus suis]MDY4646269.1 hypothetical protein [Aerococcus suis]SMC37481.1 hypothetical protein SAMN04487984_0829 [Aerococcus suis]
MVFSILEKKDKKKRNIAIGVAIISFILFGLTSPEVEDGYEASKESETQENSTNEPVEESSTSESSEESSKPVESEESSKESESESESSEEVTYDDPLEQSAHDVFGEDLRSFNVIEDSGMKDIYVEANISMNLTANMMKGSFEMDVLDYAEKVKAEGFSNIIYMAYAEATDSYGNGTEVAAGTITLSKETIGKINFEQFSRDNLPKIADNYNMNIGD